MEADPQRSLARRRLRGGHRGSCSPRGLGRTPRFVQIGFISLDAAVARGDFDIGLSGIEDSAARRRARLAVTVPYYEFREVLTVREADAPRFRTLADLRGRRVATLGATLAFDLLAAGAGRSTASCRSPTKTTCIRTATWRVGRVDAVLLDEVLAERGVRRNPGLVNQPPDVGVGHYVGILAPGNAALRDQIDALLRAGDARRPARGDLPALGHVERRSAAALRAGAGAGPRPRRTTAAAAARRA